jgi:hypothetical protein
MIRSIVGLGFICGLSLAAHADEGVSGRTGEVARPAQAAEQQPKRSWGPEQATGEPNAPNAGDSASAWASQSADGQAEWLICEFAKPTSVVAIHVHENDCPGALVKVTAFDPDGKEVVAWEGVDPTPVDKEHGVSTLKVGLGFDVQRIKLYLDSVKVPGWNEIDAVALEDDKGQKHWATKVEASSTYATTILPVHVIDEFPQPDDLKPALEKLQNDVNELKASQKELQNDIRELKELLKAALKKS